VIQGHGKPWKPEIFEENPVSGRRKCRENPVSESDMIPWKTRNHWKKYPR
jgi:hypothetical protein